MDITLERILSLIPRKPDGKFVHGAVKEFASGLGLKSGNIVSDWIAGRSTSYTGYLYQISSKYNVSVEWLKGECDEKNKPTPMGELSGIDAELARRIQALPPEGLSELENYLAYLESKRKQQE